MPLSTRVSLPARRIIEAAFRDLEKVVSTEDRVGLENTTLEDVRDAAHLVQNQLAARQWGPNMWLLVPLFKGLEHYSKTIEVLCNGTPYLAWIWAPIKLILKVSSDCVEAFEKIIRAYSRIGECLLRFREFDRAFFDNTNVQQTLAIFYVDILKFHKEAYQFVRRSYWKVFFMNSWGRFERRFECIIEDLKIHEDLVDKTCNAINITEARKMREKIESWRQQSNEKLAKDEAQLTASQYRAIIGCLEFGEADQDEVFSSIASGAAETAGTSSWIFNQKKIRCWMRCNRESIFLLLNGCPGSGKSVLSAQIATFLRAGGHSQVVAHFCTYQYQTSCEYNRILHSILIQLIRSDTDLIAHVWDRLVLGQNAASSRTIEELIRELMGASPTAPSQTKYIHLILDGLDECEPKQQERILSILEKFVAAAERSGSTVCKVLVPGRAFRSGTKTTRNKHIVSLSDEKENINKAMSHYCDSQLATLRPKLLEMKITDADWQAMQQRIVVKADGMFLWARLVLEYLNTNMFCKREEVLLAVDV
ncbi:uncharacterized protein J7T54_001546 [Emericellopsis cladophorae]|uniref:NACHT domain-containing protein n=1 Tax=Emericellopsis cladophorae TaxID=2686198 RepID=A0A9Q0BBB8_9HYPO|nr:uncharacterized protein J7T54_001546 [Emericellopsis cladophorae]KAI6777889.1 hypothetical protein J7T54_001546 [Emericellopsis cladophorae]